MINIFSLKVTNKKHTLSRLSLSLYLSHTNICFDKVKENIPGIQTKIVAFKFTFFLAAKRPLHFTLFVCQSVMTAR